MEGMMRHLLTSAIALAVLLSACSQTQKASQLPKGNKKTGSFVVAGTMRYVDVSGGCWQLEADDGRRYEVIGQNIGEIKRDGAKVELEVIPGGNLASICQVGEIIEVVRIVNIK
jgi:hypothetical protein